MGLAISKSRLGSNFRDLEIARPNSRLEKYVRVTLLRIRIKIIFSIKSQDGFNVYCNEISLP